MKQSNTSQNKKSSDIPINRGVELILGEKKKPKSPQPMFRFGKMISLFKREIHIYFEVTVKTNK